MARLRRIIWPVARHDEEPGRLLEFALAAILIGVATGLTAATFRLALEAIGHLRNSLISWAHGNYALGLIVVIGICVAATVTATALVHRLEPHAKGSGIPRTEAVVAGRISPGSPLILPVKYIGGLLAIGAGLALGREGPSVQMGGNIGIIVSRIARRNRYDLRILVAAGAAAGLATAFNAPIAGAVFVLEELVRRFDPRTTIATLLASGSGFASAGLLRGGSIIKVFKTAPLSDLSLKYVPMILVMGIIAGLGGILYNKFILTSLQYADKSRIPQELRAGIIGALIGVIAFISPELVGGGDNLTQNALLALGTVWGVLAVFVIRFMLGVISYSANTPGGLFAPMLVLGSHLGLFLGLVGKLVFPDWSPHPASLALIGMAAFFTASVQTPVTGIVLVTELTGVTNQLPPMLGACAVAMLVAVVLGSEPIYDALAARATAAESANAAT